MKRNMTILLLCLVALVGTIWALQGTRAQESGPLTGTWQCKSHGTPEGDTDFALRLEQNGEKVTGSVSAPQGGTDITSATFKNNVLEIHIDTDSGTYVLTAVLKDRELTDGKVTLDGAAQGTWEGKKGED
jgi:hypothetical protein